MKRRIEVICGKTDVVPNFSEISNTPNYVFSPDPNFDVVSLFDREGNVVNLNSWIECAYYVNGGWTNNLSDFVNGEQILFFTLLVFSSLYLVGKRMFFDRIFSS